MTKNRILCDVGGVIGSILVVVGVAQWSVGGALVASGTFILLWSTALAVAAQYKGAPPRDRNYP